MAVRRIGQSAGVRASDVLWLGAATLCLSLACRASQDEDATASQSTTEGSEAGASTETRGVTTSGSDVGSADGTTSDAGTASTTGTSSEGSAGDEGSTSTTNASIGGPEASTSSDSTGSSELGTIVGQCGLIDARELRSEDAFAFENAIDFRGHGFEEERLTPGGREVLEAGNLGGSSLYSEVVAFEVLARCEAAELVATEGEIEYLDPMGTKTDLLVEIDDLAVGVSVTRAFAFPPETPYTVDQAEPLLVDKLMDISSSTANVAPSHVWVKQVLHVIAYADQHAEAILEAYEGLDPSIRADTILLVTVTHGDDAFVY